MRFYQIVRKMNRKSSMGLTDFFSILAYALLFIVFFLLLKLAIGNITFKLYAQTSDIENSISAIGILKTPVIVDNIEMNIAELIALSNLDLTKKSLLENKLVQIIDEAFSKSHCAVMCINGIEIKGSGCGGVESYACSNAIIKIPSYDGKMIEIYFESGIEAVDIKYI